MLKRTLAAATRIHGVLKPQSNEQDKLQVTILVFKKADLALFRDLFGIKDKGTQKN